MKYLGIVCFLILAFGAVFTLAFATDDVEKGKALFYDMHFAGGVKACSSCHPNGQGLEAAGGKKEFHIMGKTQKSLEEAINFCIVNASGGKAISPKSAEMQGLVAYIKSLKTKKPAAGY